LRWPITPGELKALVGAPIGIAIGSGEADDRWGNLLRKADLALP
jgi:hypothetical protein